MDSPSWPLIDDIGSFPAPEYTSNDYFQNFYWDVYRGLIQKATVRSNRGLYTNVIHPIERTFQYKLDAGVEYPNYPQLMDMYTQFLKPMKDYEVPNEPNVVQADKAIFAEVPILEEWAKQYYEKTQSKIHLKLCITGPIELYIHQLGFSVYEDMAMNYARSVNAFLKNAMVDSKYIKTEIVAIDEPSLGYVTLSGIDDEGLIRVYDKSLDGLTTDNQIHLHSLARFRIPLLTKNINILTCEFASNTKNVIDKKHLDEYNKFMRVGICRTNFNAIMADALDKGLDYTQLSTPQGLIQLIDSEETILNNLKIASAHYGDRLKYVGPDCGLNAWGPPEVAFTLLKRTSDVVKAFRKVK